MKKTLISMLSIVLAVVMLVGCGGNGAGGGKIEGTLDEIMDKIYEGANSEVTGFKTEVTAENAEYFLGTTDLSFTEALASEPMIGAIAHSVVLVRMDAKADMAAAKKMIKDNVDPRKWICVGVEPDQVIVDSVGDLIILVMSVDAKAFVDAFQALK